MDVSRIYDNRFPMEDRKAKDAVWRVLCRRFIQKYVAEDATVLDLGSGFCEFLRHIRCGERIACDLDPRTEQHAPEGTRVVIAPAHLLKDHVDDESVDVVFASNFFEHLPDKAAFLATLEEIRRVLRPGGKLLVLQPNLRVLGGTYWDFLDHHIPLTDRTVVEAMQMVGLEVMEARPRFLPYTTRSRLPKSTFLVRLYLMCPPLWWLLGRQAWIVAMKPRTVAGDDE